VQVHGDDMIGSSARQKICDESSGLSNPLFVTWFGLENFLGLL